jgi:hypothetical protein
VVLLLGDLYAPEESTRAAWFSDGCSPNRLQITPRSRLCPLISGGCTALVELIGQLAEVALLVAWEDTTLNPQYGQTPGSPHGGPPQYLGPPAPIKQKNTLGLIALVVSIIGLVFACIKGALVVGWVLLPIAFILGIVALFQSGKTKGTGTAAIIISVVGVVVGVTVFATVVTDSVHDAFGGSNLSASPSSASSAPTTDQSNATSSAGSRENPYPIGETGSRKG